MQDVSYLDPRIQFIHPEHVYFDHVESRLLNFTGIFPVFKTLKMLGWLSGIKLIAIFIIPFA